MIRMRACPLEESARCPGVCNGEIYEFGARPTIGRANSSHSDGKVKRMRAGEWWVDGGLDTVDTFYGGLAMHPDIFWDNIAGP